VTTFFTTLGIVTGALISLGILLNPLRKKMKRWGSWMERFMRDWEGEEEEPGRDRVPGVMERLNKLDGELSNNGGSTTKDKVDKLYDNQARVIETQDKMLEAFVEMGERLISIENTLSNKETQRVN
jgi:hypothetical protein